MKKGFTLVELLIVVVILAIIFVVLLINIRTQIARGNDMTRKTDLRKIQKALEEYYNDRKTYPETPPSAPFATCGSTDMKPYLEKVPCDPVLKVGYYFISNIPSVLTPQNGYVLCTKLELKSDPDIARIGCHPVVGCGWAEGYNYCITAGTTPVEPGFDPDSYGPDGDSLTPTPTPPWIDVDPWACTKGSQAVCNSYHDPVGAGCPFVYTSGCMYNGVFQCDNPANRCTNW